MRERTSIPRCRVKVVVGVWGVTQSGGRDLIGERERRNAEVVAKRPAHGRRPVGPILHCRPRRAEVGQSGLALGNPP